MPRTRSETNQSPESQAALRELVAREGHVTPENEDTEAGNYFVANYPPFSFWLPELVPHAEKLLEEPPAEDVPPK